MWWFKFIEVLDTLGMILYFYPPCCPVGGKNASVHPNMNLKSTLCFMFYHFTGKELEKHWFPTVKFSWVLQMLSALLGQISTFVSRSFVFIFTSLHPHRPSFWSEAYSVLYLCLFHSHSPFCKDVRHHIKKKPCIQGVETANAKSSRITESWEHHWRAQVHYEIQNIKSFRMDFFFPFTIRNIVLMGASKYHYICDKAI